MVSVAICDDEVDFGAEFERTLIDIFTKLNIKHDINVFFSGEELCSQMKSGAHYDLIFLDIEFAKNTINGVEVGRIIRNNYQNNTVSIVYISWEKNYSMQLFEIRPMDFLIKPLEYDKIEKTIKTYLKIADLLTGELTFKKGHDTHKVQIKDIIFLENSKRKVIIYLTNGKKEEFYGSLKEVYNEQLKNCDFLFIHASYAVNYDHVNVVKYNQVFLTSNEKPLPISPNRRDEVRTHYLEIMKQRRL
jgi:DNA-binding LytR/AlgR family response regulator